MDTIIDTITDFIGGVFDAIPWKKVFFLLLMPIVVPVVLFMNFTYDWWLGLYKGRRLLFFLLSPIYGPLAIILYTSFGSWTDLAK